MVNQLQNYLTIATELYKWYEEALNKGYLDPEIVNKYLDFYEHVIKSIKTELILLKGKEQ